jgi:NADPH:quinone reductase-like Zn-dependent oxidoreductase
MTSNTGQQMDAVVGQASGPPAQALVVRSEPVPEPGPGEVLAEVHAAENYLVSPFDTDNEHGLATEVRWPVLSTRGEKQS